MAKRQGIEVPVWFKGNADDFVTAIKTAQKATEQARSGFNILSDSVKSLTGKFSSMKAAVLGGALLALNELKKVGKDLAETLETNIVVHNQLITVQSIWKEVQFDLVKGQLSLNDAVTHGIELAKMRTDLELREIGEIVPLAGKRAEYNKLLFDANDKTKTATERIQLYTEALKKSKELHDLLIEHKQEELKIIEAEIKAHGANVKNLRIELQLKADIITLTGEYYQENKRVHSQLTGLQDKEREEAFKRWMTEIEEANQAIEEQKRHLEDLKSETKEYAPEHQIYKWGNAVTPLDSSKLRWGANGAMDSAQKISEMKKQNKAIDDYNESLKKQFDWTGELESGFRSLFNEIYKGGNAFKALADAFVGTIERMAAELLAKKVIFWFINMVTTGGVGGIGGLLQGALGSVPVVPNVGGGALGMGSPGGSNLIAKVSGSDLLLILQRAGDNHYSNT